MTRTRTRDTWWWRPWTVPGTGPDLARRSIARAMDDGLPNTWTPHKALRRIADHLVDHLHQVEALLAAPPRCPMSGMGGR